jgi:hypothetical protein
MAEITTFNPITNFALFASHKNAAVELILIDCGHPELVEKEQRNITVLGAT